MKILKKISRNVLSVVLLYILTACTNESLVEEHNEVASYLEKGVYTFFYHGKSYSSEYVVLQDSSCLFKNKEVANLMEYYKSAPEVAVLVLNNGGYEYFDSEKELNDSLSVRTKLEGALSRSSVNFLKMRVSRYMKIQVLREEIILIVQQPKIFRLKNHLYGILI